MRKIYKYSILISFILFIGIVPAVFFYNQTSAQTADEVRRQIEEKSAEIRKLEEQIKAYQSQLESLSKQKNSLNGSLKQLDVTKKKLQTDISVTQKKIDQAVLKIEELTSDIGTKEGAILTHKNSVALEIRETAELERKTIVESILSNENLTDIWNDIDNRARVREKIIENLGYLREAKTALEGVRSESIEVKNDLQGLKTKLGDQQKIVIQNVNEKNKLLTQTKNSEANYQKLVATETAKKEAFEKELREFESKLKFILDPSKLPAGGVLSWPLDRVYVTQQFGAKTGPHRTYASGHSGVDFRARTPLPVYAMADGTVGGTGDTDVACPGVSFGKFIFIKYTNGLASTFGHLSIIKVSEGQKVSRGQLVGYTGGTGRVTGPHLHVSLYDASAARVDTVPSISCPGKILKQPIAAINAYLDPMFYLPPYVPQP